MPSRPAACWNSTPLPKGGKIRANGRGCTACEAGYGMTAMAGDNMRVLLGMSGGVDSSVAAHLLKARGYEVTGVTMKFWREEAAPPEPASCGGRPAADFARLVADRLGIAHTVLDLADRFEERVIAPFASAYRAGRTPNPCIGCNQHVKFGSLWDLAEETGAAFVATGHYAIIGNDPPSLRKGRDGHKDQSYFLFSLSNEQLGRALTPLGSLTKDEIRLLARQLGLEVAPESRDICFLQGGDYRSFLRARPGESLHPGHIRDTSGRRLGPHEGIEFFTIGQRKGLPGGSPEPRYVVAIDAERSEVIVGGGEDLLCRDLDVERVIWHAGPREGPVDVKIRYAHPGAPAMVGPLADGRARVTFREPQRAVTPGQAAVFYDGDLVLGGGWIRPTSSDPHLTLNPDRSQDSP